jgi:uncharacterized membrane protein YqhA
MKTIIEKSKYLNLIIVITLLLTFVFSLLWGAAQAVKAWRIIILSMGQSPDIILFILKLVDTFLIVIVIYILAVSIFRLFVSEEELPGKWVARSVPELKSKLSGVIVLVMAIHFVEVMLDEGIVGLEKLWQAIAISLVALVLILFSYVGASQEADDIHG